MQGAKRKTLRAETELNTAFRFAQG